MSTTEPVLRRADSPEGVTTLTMNRGPARNALSIELMGAIMDALSAIAEDETVRVLVIAGAGPAFCAGHDLRELRSHDNDPDFIRLTFESCAQLMQAIVALPQPVIARVHGVATAAGAQLVASCDLAVAADDSRFATPGVNIGLFCSTPMVALSRNVAPKHAMDMLLTGDMIPASRAYEIGLVNRLVPAAELEVATEKLAAQLAAKSAKVLRFGKQGFYHQLPLNLADAYALAAEAMIENMSFDDAAEGIGAFVEKRHPHWKDS
ncbi:enoyl-CoA hydratase [Emcibacter sp. SYSU 3D8]|uniref:enoyl-CoA hydratase n=1 Tax=Emcibacter sp. SYSU 3D8 TaxID=3133969 RepID=UPI0031FEC5F9